MGSQVEQSAWQGLSIVRIAPVDEEIDNQSWVQAPGAPMQ
jgi:hypothetical protein